MDIERLKQIRNFDELEFRYQLKNLLKKGQSEGLEEFKHIIMEFKKEIVLDSYFFIDIINEGIYYYYLNPPYDNYFNDLMEIITLIVPVGNHDTLEILHYLIKKIPGHTPEYPLLMNFFGEIEHKVSFLEQKIKKLKLYPPKSIIVEWYE